MEKEKKIGEIYDKWGIEITEDSGDEYGGLG